MTNPTDILARAQPSSIEEYWGAILPDKCVGCELCGSRKQIVRNRGDGSNGIMLVGEGPGEREDVQGLGFVGPAGQYLDAMLIDAGIDPSKCWMTNTVKCKPPTISIKPRRDQMEICRSFLRAEMGLVSPLIIIALGKYALASISDDFSPTLTVSRVKGRIQLSNTLDREFITTYHPSYVARAAGTFGQITKPAEYWEVVRHFALARRVAEVERKSRQ